MTARPWRLRALLLAALLATGCAGTGLGRRSGADEPDLAAQVEREAKLVAAEAWSFSGRIAVSDGRDGGSGRITWRQRGTGYVIEIQAPVSRRSWRLRSTADGAVLEGLDGGPRHGPDAETLLSREVGWHVPFADLTAWARGLRGRGAAEIQFDEASRPRQLRQRGWTVDYRGWNEAQPPLPTRLFAARGERRVRLVVDRWEANGPRG